MAKITFADPWRLRRPALASGLMVDTFRGQVRVRSWPRKRGKPKSKAVLEQNEWFRAANKLTRVSATTQQRMAVEVTKKSGLYPRDLLMRSISGGPFDIRSEDGSLIQMRRPEVLLAGFQGARLQLTANQLITSPGPYKVVWEDPVIDTAAMWSIGDPTWLVVPMDINLAEFTAGIWSNGAGSGTTFLIESDQGEIAALMFLTSGDRPRMTMTTGPLPVTPGHKWRLSISNNAPSWTIEAQPASYLAATISTIIDT